MNSKISLLICGLTLASIPYCLQAETPVKSVDQAGNVTYSDKPVVGAASVSKVPIEPGPSGVEIDAAKQRAGEKIKRADQAQVKRDALTKAQEAERKAEKSSRVTVEKVEAGGQSYYDNNRFVRPIVKPPGDRPDRPVGRPPVNRPSPRATGR
ncbi:MAG: hypothetical protein DRQ61_03780 [Gammaproteobacteria bacterium]|nr:MAG: hypothetical protein DRQ61_03780 [Gammaproteobacteria bacterium]